MTDIVRGLFFLRFWLQPAQIIPVVIIRGHEDVLRAETQSDE